jgi:hypothetical protein
LTSYSDWDKLSYSAGGNFASGQSAKPQQLMVTTWVDELSYEQHRKDMENSVVQPQ